MELPRSLSRYIDEQDLEVVEREEQQLLNSIKGSHFLEETVKSVIRKEKFITIRVTEDLEQRLIIACKGMKQDRSKLVRKSILAMLDYYDRHLKAKIVEEDGDV
jgi:predicted DNA binding CopG/RHH family protein